MSIPVSLLAVRGSQGLAMVEGCGTAWERADATRFSPDPSKSVKVVSFSPCGESLAWSNGEAVHVARFKDGKFRAADFGPLPHSRVSFLAFSPCGSTLATWELFATKPGQAPQPNLHLWAVAKDGAKVASFVQKKNAFWCPQWSQDEKVCVIKSQNNELNFYENGDFSAPLHRLSQAKLDTFQLSPRASGPRYPIVTFVPGQKGGPGFGKLFCYPNFNPEKDFVANKSFMQADRLDVEWSHDGSRCLLLSQADVDKTGASYYGKQQLHYMSASGDTSAVQLPKEGPIYHIEWSPAQAEFCVVYGYMPAKATIFNTKCEKVFDFGTGPRNMAVYNPQGSIVMLAGFGNLRGNIEMWSVKDKKLIAKFEASDSTHVQWAPDGQRIMTSTCAPRLRQGNGYKIWHYTSSLLCEESVNNPDELWEVCWQNRPALTTTPFAIQYKPVQGIEPKQPVASKQAYRPPGARNKPESMLNTKLHNEDEPAENEAKNGGTESLSKSAAKNKKRKENAAKKKAAEAAAAAAEPTGKAAALAAASSLAAANGAAPAGGAAPAPGSSSLEVEKAKKVRKLNDKLNQIAKLKAQQKEGKKLELNQIEKLNKEQEIIEEMKRLQT